MNGFTLMELVLVILIISVIAVAAAPRIEDLLGVDVYAATRQMASDMKSAQSLAISERRRWGVRFEPAQQRYVLFNSVTGDSLVRQLNGVAIVSADFGGGNEVQFNSLGAPYLDAAQEMTAVGRVVVSANGVADTLNVWPLTGRVRF